MIQLADSKIHFAVMGYDTWHQVSRHYPYDHIAIGFRTPRVNYHHPVMFSPWCKGHIEIFTHDFTPQESMGNSQIILFSKNHAKKILELVEREKNNIYHIVCQCDAGISRSSAVAAALSKILYNDDMWVFENRRFVPNMHVYSTILKEYYKYEAKDLFKMM